MLCRLFLYSACENYEAYDLPDFSDNKYIQEWKPTVSSLLQIDSGSRVTPDELYNQLANKAKSKNTDFPANLSSASLISETSSTTLENSSVLLSSTEDEVIFS